MQVQEAQKRLEQLSQQKWQKGATLHLLYLWWRVWHDNRDYLALFDKFRNSSCKIDSSRDWKKLLANKTENQSLSKWQILFWRLSFFYIQYKSLPYEHIWKSEKKKLSCRLVGVAWVYEDAFFKLFQSRTVANQNF
jgi:hypothetical protein